MIQNEKARAPRHRSPGALIPESFCFLGVSAPLWSGNVVRELPVLG